MQHVQVYITIVMKHLDRMISVSSKVLMIKGWLVEYIWSWERSYFLSYFTGTGEKRLEHLSPSCSDINSSLFQKYPPGGDTVGCTVPRLVCDVKAVRLRQCQCQCQCQTVLTLWHRNTSGGGSSELGGGDWTTQRLLITATRMKKIHIIIIVNSCGSTLFLLYEKLV